MREILFRGKRLDNGEWIEGYYVKTVDYRTDSAVHLIIELPSAFYPRGEIAGEYEINSSTVGQYTGLTDKNGKKIFEGDIVVVPLSGKSAKGIIKYFKTDICGFTVITQPQYSNYVLQKNCAYEVIGNIHDNPELLEVTE
ncbi:MAG: hypothetical protein II410_08450 [Ruminococcus sp.]|nr:hypothetical protein [Ruminococcus sp.]MBQ2442428.1 hypothetical protein [Ruminococcus sp.]MBQ4171651.1 hypothetical protein [Ruminococcus sp.]